MKNRLIVDQATNTLIKYKYIVYGERLDYLVILHKYNRMQTHSIGPHCFNDLIIN